MLNKIIYQIPIVLRGKPHKVIALVLIFLACKKYNMPITLQKITKMAKLKRKLVNKCYKIVKRILPETTMYKAKPIIFLQNINKNLGLDEKTFNLAKDILKQLETMNLS
jgi:transcription initiation factor TFIIIB Brf1 subunit/transcription initiation factor TFIIB